MPKTLFDIVLDVTVFCSHLSSVCPQDVSTIWAHLWEIITAEKNRQSNQSVPVQPQVIPDRRHGITIHVWVLQKGQISSAQRIYPKQLQKVVFQMCNLHTFINLQMEIKP